MEQGSEMESQSGAENLPSKNDAMEALRGARPDLKDPEVVLSLLEADQVVAAKQTRFGRKKLSFKTQLMLWGLRIYVIIMLVIVAISVYRALHAGR